MPATRHRFTLDDWHRLIEIGVLREDQRLELLDGEIYEMASIGPSRQGAVSFLTRFRVTKLGTRAVVSVQGPVTAPPRSEPQPDLALLRDRPDFYRAAHSAGSLDRQPARPVRRDLPNAERRHVP